MQQHSLLATKLCIPPIRRELVSRPRLIERLNVGLSGSLTLVSAPADFGKTTLVSEWVTGCNTSNQGFVLLGYRWTKATTIRPASWPT